MANCFQREGSQATRRISREISTLHAVQLATPPAPDLLVAQRDRIHPLDQLLLPLVQRDDLSELRADLGLLFCIGGAAFFHVPQVYKIVQFLFALLQQLGDLDHAQLHQRRNG